MLSDPLDPFCHDYGWALNRLQQFNQRVARSGWNDKQMWLILIPYWNSPFGRNDPEGALVRVPFIALKTADGKLVPWTLSQTDGLALDWGPVNP